MRVRLDMEVTGAVTSFEVTGIGNDGQEYARGHSSESIPRALDFAIASVVAKRGKNAWLVTQFLTGLRKLFGASPKPS